MISERIHLLLKAFRDTNGLARGEILSAVFTGNRYYVHAYYLLIKGM